jgi:hypothetical protein
MRSRRVVLLASLFALIPTTLASQPESPPRRAHHALIYDGSRERVILTGGSTPLDGGQRFEFFNDLWEFDGARWRSLPPSGDRLSGVGLAYDARRQQLVSYGGFDGKARGLVRVLRDNTWTTLGDRTERVAAEPGFVYDSARDRFVAFGGSAGMGQAYGDTWEYDGTNWTRKEIVGPPARQAHVMVYDERRNRVVVFGGMAITPGAQPTPLADTWEYDGIRWQKIDVAGPSARLSAGATYDAMRGLVILFGGSSPAGFNGDTWSYDGRAWRKLSDAGPEPRAMGAIAYDRKRDRTVLFGGRKGYPDGDLADTWEWDGTAWQRR